jgi:hypothetical protein
MTAVEELAEKARQLDPMRLQLLTELADFLLTKQASDDAEGHAPAQASGSPFPKTQLEPPDAPSVYRGPALSLERMRDAVDWEAGQRR